MRLKEFSDKYGYDYHIPYKAMIEDEKIITHLHDVEYDENEIYHAVMNYFGRREMKFKNKARTYEIKKIRLKEKYFNAQSD